MEIIYHERKPNYLATIKSMGVGDEVTFPWDEVKCDPSFIRTICAKQPGTFSVNKGITGMTVTRTA